MGVSEKKTLESLPIPLQEIMRNNVLTRPRSSSHCVNRLLVIILTKPSSQNIPCSCRHYIDTPNVNSALENKSMDNSELWGVIARREKNYVHLLMVHRAPPTRSDSLGARLFHGRVASGGKKRKRLLILLLDVHGSQQASHYLEYIHGHWA